MLDSGFSDKLLTMFVTLRHLLGWVVSAFRAREDLVLENLALRQQLLALHTQRPHRRFSALHKLFWVALRTCWSGWKEPLALVRPSNSGTARLVPASSTACMMSSNNSCWSVGALSKHCPTFNSYNKIRFLARTPQRTRTEPWEHRLLPNRLPAHKILNAFDLKD
jgi:hypothetical protein